MGIKTGVFISLCPVFNIPALAEVEEQDESIVNKENFI